MLGNSEFPISVKYRSTENSVYLLQSFFKIYSKLAFTHLTDRSVAISGLESRFASAFGTKVSYGISQRYLHWSILWQRSTAKRMERIEYSSEKEVPSWSWMAYEGEISYMDIRFEEVEWSDAIKWNPSKFPELQGPVRGFRNCTIESQVAKCDISVTGADDERGWLMFDRKDITNIEELKCVVVGRAYQRQETDGREYYILVVKRKREGGPYERVGVGSIQRRHISFEGEEFEGRVF